MNPGYTKKSYRRHYDNKFATFDYFKLAWEWTQAGLSLEELEQTMIDICMCKR